MNVILKNKFAMIAGSAVIAGGLLTGVAFAASAATTAPAANATAPAVNAPAPATGATAPAEAKTAETEQNDAAELAQAVKDGKLTQAEADVQTQLDGLRTAAMTKLQADSKVIIDQAVKDGKLTQAQADTLVNHKGRGGFGHGGNHEHQGNENGPEGADDQAAPASSN